MKLHDCPERNTLLLSGSQFFFLLFICQILEGYKNAYQTNRKLSSITVMVLVGIKLKKKKNYDVT